MKILSFPTAITSAAITGVTFFMRWFFTKYFCNHTKQFMISGIHCTYDETFIIYITFHQHDHCLYNIFNINKTCNTFCIPWKIIIYIFKNSRRSFAPVSSPKNNGGIYITALNPSPAARHTSISARNLDLPYSLLLVSSLHFHFLRNRFIFSYSSNAETELTTIIFQYLQ